MTELNGAPNPQDADLLLKRIVELEETLAKRTYERDKARKMVNDLCDHLLPDDRFTDEDIEKMLAEGGHTSIGEILLEFGYPAQDAA